MSVTLQYGTTTPGRGLARASALAGLYPLLLAAAVYASATATRVVLGYWPRWPIDVPAVGALHAFAMLLLVGIPFAAGASIGLGVRCLLEGLRWPLLGVGVALPLACWTLWLALAVADPGHVWAWFMD